jgi:hypothetical protein
MADFAANTAGRDAKRSTWGDVVAFLMAATTIYKGDIVYMATATGYVQSLVADASLATGDVFMGVAAETKTAAVAGMIRINCYVTGVFEFKTTETAAVGNIGELIYADPGSDATPSHCIIGTGSLHDLPIGTCVDFPSTALRLVRINDYACHAGHGTAS